MTARHRILSEHLLRRTARQERDRILHLQQDAREEGGDWPPTDEPARQAVYALGITPTTTIVVEPERRRFKWAVVAVGASA